MFRLLRQGSQSFLYSRTGAVLLLGCFPVYMWTYSTDAVASEAFGAPSMQQVTGITVDRQEYNDNIYSTASSLCLRMAVLLLAWCED